MNRLRIATLTLASIGLVSAASVVALAGPASAGSKHAIKCSGGSGSVSSNTFNLTGCNGNTGGSGTVSVASLASGSGPINWANGTVTNVSISFSQLPKEHGCPSKNDSEYSVTGSVVSDTSGSAQPPSHVKGKACLGGTSGDGNTLTGKGHFKV